MSLIDFALMTRTGTEINVICLISNKSTGEFSIENFTTDNRCSDVSFDNQNAYVGIISSVKENVMLVHTYRYIIEEE